MKIQKYGILRHLTNHDFRIVVILYRFFQTKNVNLLEFIKEKKIKEIIKSDLVNENKQVLISFAIFLIVYILKVLRISGYLPIIHLIASLSFIFFLIKTIPSLLKKGSLSTGKNADYIKFGVIGAIIGLPASYYFQPGIVRSQSLVRYFEDFDYYLKHEGLLTNIITSIVVFIIIGLVFAYFKNKK